MAAHDKRVFPVSFANAPSMHTQTRQEPQEKPDGKASEDGKGPREKMLTQASWLNSTK